MVLQAREDLFDVADAYGAAGGALEGVVAGEGEVDAVFVAVPLFVSEEAAEVGEPEADSFVCAESLCIILELSAPDDMLR